MSGPFSSGVRRGGLLSLVGGFVLPFLVALCWVPIRSKLPNVDLALLLVVLAAGVGALGQRPGVVATAFSGALWFEFFDTAPFERLGIARNPDVETTLVLALASLIVGELALRVRRHRQFARAGQEDLATVRSVASLVASGEELVRVIEEVVGDLTRLLDLSGCWFESGPPEKDRFQVSGEGQLVRPPGRPVGAVLTAELPVDAQGERIGHFVLEFGSDKAPEPEKLQVALTLAAALGGAFLAQAPPPLPPERQPVLPLRLLGPAGGAELSPGGEASGGPESQETSGFSLAVGSMRP